MLKEYTRADFKLLQEWITDADLLLQFSGTDWTFLLTPEQLELQLSRYPDRIFYIGYDDKNTPYAFGQLIMNENNAPRLGRLLIGNAANRGKGMGQRFVKELIVQCTKLQPGKDIHLFVEENNLGAIQCYEKVGFQFTADEPFIMKGPDKEMKILKMTYQLSK